MFGVTYEYFPLPLNYNATKNRLLILSNEKRVDNVLDIGICDLNSPGRHVISYFFEKSTDHTLLGNRLATYTRVVFYEIQNLNGYTWMQTDLEFPVLRNDH